MPQKSDSYINERMSQEYDTLRKEIIENKKFIFERPMVTIVAIIALMQSIGDNPAVLILPTIAIGLLIFNLLFTVNRLKSSANMIAYIQLFHEGIFRVRWMGWENFLFFQRQIENTQISKNKNQISGIMEKILADKTTRLFNYQRLYLLHICAIIVFIIFPIFTLHLKINHWNLWMDSRVIADVFIKICIILFNFIIFLLFIILRVDEISPENIVTQIGSYRKFIINHINRMERMHRDLANIGNTKMLDHSKSCLLILLPCQCVYDRVTDSIYAEHLTDRSVYENQILFAFKHINNMKRSKKPLMVISGGYTKKKLKISESKSYIHMARFLNITVPENVVLEEFALTSIENLLFSLYVYKENIGHYPEEIDIISWDFKEKRYKAILHSIKKWEKIPTEWTDLNFYPVGRLKDHELQKAIPHERRYIQSLNKGLETYFQDKEVKDLIIKRDVYHLREKTKERYHDFPMPW